MSTTRVMLAEAIGTFFLCFAGIAAILSTQAPINSGAGLVGIALAHGLALSIAVSVFGGVSGGHHNPAVTIGILAAGRIKPDRAIQYILAQLAGATIAALLCMKFFPSDAVKGAMLGIPLPSPQNMPGAEGAWLTLPILLGLEFVGTFLLVTAVFGTAVDERGQVVNIGGFAIGLTVAFDILAFGSVTGASMNPARSFGPALIYKLMGGDAGAGAFQLHWCYWVAPIAGGVVAALMYEKLILGNDSDG